MVSAQRLAAMAAEMRGWLAANADPAMVAKYARYFKEGYDAYGIESKPYDLQAAMWSKEYGPELGLAGCLDLGDLLFATGKYEEGTLAVRLIKGFRRQIDGSAVGRIGRWLDSVQNWAHCDVICGELLAPGLKASQFDARDLAGWRASPFRFKRRAVSVTLLGLVKQRERTEDLLGLLKPMMLDPERVVHQGLGWFLREAWKVNPEPVEVFLLEWKDTAPRLIFQYATEKMTPEGKGRFRRSRKS